MADDKKKILVVGGGIAGITAALEAAEVGNDVILIERNPYLGGRVAQMYRYFPKLCPPSCGLEINYQAAQEQPTHRRATPRPRSPRSPGSEGDFEVQVEIQPRYVNDKCTGCGKCAEACDARGRQPLQLRHEQDEGGLPAHPQRLPGALCAAP